MPAATMQNRRRKQPIRQETPKGSEAPDPPVLAMTTSDTKGKAMPNVPTPTTNHGPSEGPSSKARDPAAPSSERASTTNSTIVRSFQDDYRQMGPVQER